MEQNWSQPRFQGAPPEFVPWRAHEGWQEVGAMHEMWTEIYIMKQIAS